MIRFFNFNKENLPFYEDFSKRIRTTYYENAAAYKKQWKARAELLIDMFEKREAEKGIVYEVAEFGCGPNAPVSAVCADKKRYMLTKFDIKQWDQDTKILNLNDQSSELPLTNIAVFAGVLEYLDDVEQVLSKCIKKSDYILLSYAFLPSFTKKLIFLSERSFLKEINFRSARNGWRNHYTNEELINMCTKIGVISAVNIWENKQSLVLIKHRKLG